MNPPNCNEEDYINFVIATPKQLTATEAARVQPESKDAPAHDAFTRLPERLEDRGRTTFYCACGRFSDWKVIGFEKKSVGIRRKSVLFEMQCGLIWQILDIRSIQLRNFYQKNSVSLW